MLRLCETRAQFNYVSYILQNERGNEDDRRSIFYGWRTSGTPCQNSRLISSFLLSRDTLSSENSECVTSNSIDADRRDGVTTMHVISSSLA